MRVLFVGNSYTLYHDVPAQVAALGAADGVAIETDRVARGGARLKQHVEETGALARVAEPGWTHVVLQEMSTGTLHDAGDYHRYVRILAERVAGAVLLYETWARREGHAVYRFGWSGKRPSVFLRRVRGELEAAAAELDAAIVPVGTAWERALERYPDLVLHDTDGHHANALGAHLAASVFYASLTGRDPEPIPWRPGDVARADAARLRRVARDVVSAA